MRISDLNFVLMLTALPETVQRKKRSVMFLETGALILEQNDDIEFCKKKIVSGRQAKFVFFSSI